MEHTLPPLPYAYNALEPHIDEQTMRIHHDRHHAAHHGRELQQAVLLEFGVGQVGNALHHVMPSAANTRAREAATLPLPLTRI